MIGTDYYALLRQTSPEIVLALAALCILVLDLGFLNRLPLPIRCRLASIMGRLACLLAGFALYWSLMPSVPGGPPNAVPGAMLLATGLTPLLQFALLLLTGLLFVPVGSARFTAHVGEYCALLLFATTAMMLLVSTQNLLIIFIAVEFLSLSLYVLTAFDKQSRRGAEAGLKYFLFGGVSAAMLLFGISLLYGLSGSLALPVIAEAARHAPRDPLLSVAIVLVAAGFGFKIAAAPFHMWAPEVYQGAPTISAALIASSSKVASLYAMFVVFCIGLAGASGSAAWGHFAFGWAPALALMAGLSMVWGNVAAVAATSMRRLLAYSAAAHAGYMLIGLVVHSQQSLAAAMYYVLTYALASFGLFAALSALDEQGIDRIDDFAGLAQRAPGLSFCLLIFLLSLAGVPPLAGFFGKFYLFASALEASAHLGELPLVVLALASSVVSFFYYLKVLKQIYVRPPSPASPSINISLDMRAIVWASAALVTILGCAPEWLLHRLNLLVKTFPGLL